MNFHTNIKRNVIHSLQISAFRYNSLLYPEIYKVQATLQIEYSSNYR